MPNTKNEYSKSSNRVTHAYDMTNHDKLLMVFKLIKTDMTSLEVIVALKLLQEVMREIRTK